MKCLIVSGVHGNWPALQAVLAAEPDADQILCLGDLVNYGPQPAECVAWAMHSHPPNRIVCALGKYLLEQTTAAPVNSQLTPPMKRFLASLEPAQQFRWGESLCFACHRISDHPLEFERLEDVNWNATELARMHSDIILTGIPGILFVLVGHPDFLFLADSNQAMHMELNGTEIVNPGSLGLPADGDPRAAYAVWQNGEVALHRLAYEVEETARAYERLNLDEELKRQLADNLRAGTFLATHDADELVALS